MNRKRCRNYTQRKKIYTLAYSFICCLSMILLISQHALAEETPPSFREDILLSSPTDTPSPWQVADGLPFLWQQTAPLPASLYRPPQIELTATDLSCRAAILIDCNLGMTLFEKNADLSLYPASVTKLLTAWVVLEQIDDLSQSFTLQNSDFNGLYAQHASLSGFYSGETVSYLDLLYSLLLVSGCDSAQALARAVAGNETAFSEYMNEKVAALGLTHSRFTNASGLHGDEHYTTARDMALIFQAALENPRLREILSSESYVSTPTPQHPEGLTLRSYFFWRLEHDYAGKYLEGGLEILGGKTGYTDAAGLCLAAYAQKNGHTYIAVVLGGPGNSRTEQYNFSDVIALFKQL